MPIGNIQHTAGTEFNAAVQAQPARVSPLVRQQEAGDGITRVRDAKGRQIGVKPVTAIDMFDLTMAMGEHASNAALFRQAMVAGAAVEIDGDHVARPSSLTTIRALIARLDFAGFVAVSTALSQAALVDVVNDDAVKN
jgi:hypothetical protein